MTTLEYREKLERYRSLHCACPVCGSGDYFTTTMGCGVDIDGNIVDRNRVECECGWRGIGDQLVANKLTDE